MIINANVFVGKSLYDNSLSYDKLIFLMHSNNVSKAIIRALKPTDFDFDKANKLISEMQRKDSNLIGFARVNPLMKESVLHIEKAINEYDLKGVHLHPWEENYAINNRVVDKIMKKVSDSNILVYVSAGYPVVSHPLQVQNLIDRYPEVTFILTHGGQQDFSGLSFDDTLIVAEENKNAYFDVSGVYRGNFIELLIKYAGDDRIIFGSCSPYMNMKFEITRINSTDLSEKIKNKIFYENIENLLQNNIQS